MAANALRDSRAFRVQAFSSRHRSAFLVMVPRIKAKEKPEIDARIERFRVDGGPVQLLVDVCAPTKFDEVEKDRAGRRATRLVR